MSVCDQDTGEELISPSNFPKLYNKVTYLDICVAITPLYGKCSIDRVRPSVSYYCLLNETLPNRVHN